MIWLDRKYLNLISSRLERFAWKSNKLANCRCPLCGDSQKNKMKTRGYFYEQNNTFMFKCHNCNIALPFAKLLKDIDGGLYKEFLMEKYKGSPAIEIHSEHKKEVKKRLINVDLPSIEWLLGSAKTEQNNKAISFVKRRRIPEKFYSSLFYTFNFRLFIDKLVPDHGKKNLPNDERIVIPFRGKDGRLIAVQGRSLDPDCDIRYITIKTEIETPKIYGLDKFEADKLGYILEGPFDSMFLENSIAAAGSNLKELRSSTDTSKAIFIFDNEPRNPDIIRNMLGVIDGGQKLFLWPQTILAKDINDWVLDGCSVSEIVKVIHSNIVSGLEGKFRINSWKRI